MKTHRLPLLLICGVGCMETGDLPVTSTAREGLAIELLDFDGQAHEANRAPRRPRISLTLGAPWEPAADSLLLLAGPSRDALTDDLARPPLRAEHREQALPMHLEPTRQGVIVTPLEALEPDADYILAIAAWARDALGASFLEAETPLLWPFHTSRGASAGATVIEAFPADGSSGIGTNLHAAVVVLDGEVRDADRGVWLEGPDGLAAEASVEAGPCERLSPYHSGVTCIVVRPSYVDGRRLFPLALYRLVVGDVVRDATGAPIGPWSATFRTAEASDERPPQLEPLVCGIDELALEVGCALVDDQAITLRVRASEPVLAALSDAERSAKTSAPRGDATLRLSELTPETTLALQLRLNDAAGLSLEREFSIATAPPLPTLSIVEVRADPQGPEPAQEYVELVNYGARAVDLRGISLDDRTDSRAAPVERNLAIEPAGRVLLVADDFDPGNALDVAPPPGAPLVRLGRSLGTSGLANAGEAIFLRDADGHRLSAAPATPRPRPGVCLVRVTDEMRDGSEGSFDHDPNATCTPGR